MNGVGTKAVNALSSYFRVQSFRDGETKSAEFSAGIITSDPKVAKTTEPNGTLIEFIADETIFKHYRYRPEYIENQLWNYAYLNAGLKMNYNGKTLVSKNGLRDLLERKTDVENLLYPIIHLKAEDIEIAISHNTSYGEEYYSFVNGQNTTQGVNASRCIQRSHSQNHPGILQ